MPFDPTNWLQPNITVLPPTPPGYDGPRRIRIEIEIVDKRRPVRPFRLWPWVLLFILLAMAAYAQPRHEHWQDTNGWHGETRTQGTTTDWDANGPRGEQKHCHRYMVGSTANTSCR